MDRFPHLFSPITIRNVILRNRIVSTAHGTFMSENGLPTERIAAYHAARAAGGAGLIVMEATSVHATAVGASHYATAHTDACIPGYRRVVDAIRAHGAAVFGQLYHPGHEDIAGSTDDGTLAVCYAPSAAPAEAIQLMPRPMPRSLIAEVTQAYGDAAARLAIAGVDGIEVMAHDGHLVSQFLNPRINLRRDEYGGSLDNRLRFVREIIESVRRRVGDALALGVRVSGADMDAEGLSGEETVEICAALDGLGEIDYYSVMIGAGTSYQTNIYAISNMAVETGLVAPYASAVKAVVSKPVLATERINHPRLAEQMIANGQADLCGMTRAQICDPELANKAQTGRSEDIRVCIACNQACIGHGAKGAAVSCIQFPESGRELVYGSLQPTHRRRRVFVAGGGPAGMKAAAVAGSRGHQVVLFERERELGGQAVLASLLPGRKSFAELVRNLTREVEQAGVEVRVGQALCADTIRRQAPDVVIVATGGRSYRPAIVGEESAHVVDAWDVVRGTVEVGKSAVVVDARLDWLGLGVAEKLARAGHAVKLYLLGRSPGARMYSIGADYWAGELHRLGVSVLPYMRLVSVDRNRICFEHAVTREPIEPIAADTLVVALGTIQAPTMEDELEAFPGEVHLIGDCLAPRTVEEATLEGLRVAASL